MSSEEPEKYEYPFQDKNGVDIKPGCVIRFVSNEVTGERQSGRGRNKNTFSTHGDVEIVGAVRLGIYTRDEIYTYWIDTSQTLTYLTHFWQTRPSDPLRNYTAKLSRPLTRGIASKCEVVVPSSGTLNTLPQDAPLLRGGKTGD